MANAVMFSGCSVLQIQPKNVSFRTTSLGFTTTKVDVFQYWKPSGVNRLGLAMAASPFPSQDQDPLAGSFSPAERVEELYKCINEKNIKGIKEMVSEDCCIEDLSFPKPFHGKKEVLKFFKDLTTSMGKNMKFKIKNVEEDEVTAWANWHLEWKERQIPFTRGCSFYEFTKEGLSLNIRKAQVIIESPIKPGGLVLILLKTVTSFFDEFPQAAEWFLRSQRILGQWAHQIYAILVAPLTQPILESYINFWKFMAQIIAYAISIIIYLVKIFFN